MAGVLVVMAGVSGCQKVLPGRGAGAAFSKAATTGTATPAPLQLPLPKAQLTPHLGLSCVSAPHGFSCVMQQRIRRVRRHLAGQPGQIGVVLHDRKTGATWENANARTDLPAASTVKLAMVTDLLLRRRSGTIGLGGYDWELIGSVLSASSDTAADQLWFSFEDASFLQRIQHFGMHTASFTSSHRMRRVAPIQQWGVWGAGPDHDPGNKDGWEDDGGVWVVNTVGFAGPRARYTLAIMDDLGGAGDFHQGTTTLDQIAALLFRGHYGPVPTVKATP